MTILDNGTITGLPVSKLSDTNISAPIINGQVLTYDAGSSVWTNQSIPVQSVASINDIGDVTITAPSDGEFLKYDNATSQWINIPFPPIPSLANFSFINDIIEINGSTKLDFIVNGVRLTGSTSGELILKASATTTDHTLTLPSAQGSAYSVLENDGSDGLSWRVGPVLRFAKQGALLDVDPGTSYKIPLSSLVDASSFNRFKAVDLATFDPDSMLSSDKVTVDSTGWYQISVYVFHPDTTVNTSSAQVGTGTTRLNIRINGVSNTYEELMCTKDAHTGTGECFSSDNIYYLSANDYFELYIDGTSQTNEDYIVRL